MNALSLSPSPALSHTIPHAPISRQNEQGGRGEKQKKQCSTRGGRRLVHVTMIAPLIPQPDLSPMTLPPNPNLRPEALSPCIHAPVYPATQLNPRPEALNPYTHAPTLHSAPDTRHPAPDTLIQTVALDLSALVPRADERHEFAKKTEAKV